MFSAFCHCDYNLSYLGRKQYCYFVFFIRILRQFLYRNFALIVAYTSDFVKQAKHNLGTLFSAEISAFQPSYGELRSVFQTGFFKDSADVISYRSV